MGTGDGRKGYDKWFATSPRLMAIVADVHSMVDEHRMAKGLPPWDWDTPNRKRQALKKPRVTKVKKVAMGAGGSGV